jgi:hypothetical protein
LGIGHWGSPPTPNPQSPIPNPQSPIPIRVSFEYPNFPLLKILIFNLNKYFIIFYYLRKP